MSFSKPGQDAQGPPGPGGQQQPNYLKAHFAPPPNQAMQPTPPQLYMPGSPETPAAAQPMQGTSSNPTGSNTVDPAQMQQLIQQLTQSQLPPNSTMGMQQQQAGTLTYPSSATGMPFGT